MITTSNKRDMGASQLHRDMIPNSSTLVLSYLGIRRAIGVSGLLLPIALGPIGWLFGIAIQDNLSSYYHTPLRDVFVGTLCAIGIFLFCYRGYDWIENWTANVGCAFAAAWLAKGRTILTEIGFDVLAISSQLLMDRQPADQKSPEDND